MWFKEKGGASLVTLEVQYLTTDHRSNTHLFPPANPISILPAPLRFFHDDEKYQVKYNIPRTSYFITRFRNSGKEATLARREGPEPFVLCWIVAWTFRRRTLTAHVTERGNHRTDRHDAQSYWRFHCREAAQLAVLYSPRSDESVRIRLLSDRNTTFAAKKKVWDVSSEYNSSLNH